MTLILGAMDGEVATILSLMDLDAREEWRGFPIAHGSIAGAQVVVSRTGVGKTLSAMISQYLIDRFSPERIIFTGVAGALRDRLEIGDTLVARDSMQHDMDVTALGFEIGRIPYSAHRIYPCDERLVEIASRIDPPHGTRHVGRVLTGDQFVANAGHRERLAAELDGDAVEMEGASVGLVAAVNGVPYLLIRTISDQSDGSAIEFDRIVGFAADNSWHYLQGILGELVDGGDD
ncbi:MAG: 5'-methylthioadenosine/adenosylhomocysteine nucleosidase [Spirochaetota bacterium]